MNQKKQKPLMIKSTKHQFALYSKTILHITDTLSITEPDLIQRISKVLRLQHGQPIIMFDGHTVCEGVIETIEKKQILIRCIHNQVVTHIKPAIHCIVPVLKRDALEDVIYAAVELGATSIQLVFTEKVQRPWAGAKEFERLQAIMIAACEQAKQFAIPELLAPIAFTDVIQKLAGVALFFDADGKPAFQVMTMLQKEIYAGSGNRSDSEMITMMIGPEADLTVDEKNMLKERGVIFCKLTPSVLRARQAFAVGLGMLRSLINS